MTQASQYVTNQHACQTERLIFGKDDFPIRLLGLVRAYFSVTGVASRINRVNSELLRVAYCEGARYVTCMIIPVLPIMLRAGADRA